MTEFSHIFVDFDEVSKLFKHFVITIMLWLSLIDSCFQISW